MSYFNYQSKNIFYQEIGKGKPVLFLHGDTASSKMFELLLPLYTEHFKVILIDFLGNGQSDRINELPIDLWYSQARQVIALLEHLNYGKVSLVGTSGGAWSAVNVALDRSDLINKVVADSFDGRTLQKDFSTNLIAERTFAKSDAMARQFYEWCNGEDWEAVVDLNTKILTAFASTEKPLFHKPLQTLAVPILLLGSKQDSMCRKDLVNEYESMLKLIPNGKMHIFETGDHPAIVSNAEDAAELIIKFVNQ